MTMFRLHGNLKYTIKRVKSEKKKGGRDHVVPVYAFRKLCLKDFGVNEFNETKAPNDRGDNVQEQILSG